MRSCAPPQRALPLTPSSPPRSCGVLVCRLDMLLAPTAWRRRFFVRARNMCGPGRKPRYWPAAGEELGRARIGLNPRGLRSNDTPRPCVPAQVLLHCARRFRALGELLGPLRSRRDAAGAGPDRPGLRRARRGFLGMATCPKALRGSFSQPPGRKVPAGACAGGSRVTPGGGQVVRAARAQEQVQVGARCGARIAR